MIRRALFAAALLSAVAASAEVPKGRWDATIRAGELRVPFPIHFERDGAEFAGTLVNGDARLRSTSGSFDGKTVRLEFADTGARLEAVLLDGGLKGTFGSARIGVHPFQASPYCTCGFNGEAGPDISGQWEASALAWRIAVKRVEEDTIATISMAGRDAGPLSGRFNGAFFELSYFDGGRAVMLEIAPRKDGGLDVSWMEPGVAPKKGIAVRSTATR